MTMAESIPRYTSKAEGFRTADELAALRPVKANAPKQRKPSAKPAMVASGIVCFCGERFSEAQALEFMKHLRAEVGADLALVERKRAGDRVANMSPERTEQRRRSRIERYARKMADPEWREQESARQRAYRNRMMADPGYHERYNAYRREYRARRKAEREARSEP